MNVLRLTLHKKAFEVMVTGEKKKEFRRVSTWIASRLIKPNKTNGWQKRAYARVEFTNGYGSDKPRFTCRFLGFSYIKSIEAHTYSNGLLVESSDPAYVIHLGEILSVENYTIPQHQ